MSENNNKNTVNYLNVISVGQFCMDELYKIAQISPNIQNLLLQNPILNCYIAVPAKLIQYEELGVVNNKEMFIKLPHSKQEQERFSQMKHMIIEKVELNKVTAVIKEEDGKLKVKNLSEETLVQLKEVWKIAKKRPGFLIRAFRTTVSFGKGLLGIRSKDVLRLPFPLFRDKIFNVFSGTKKEFREIIFEELRKRYETKRDIEKVPSKNILTANLDHMRLLFYENSPIHREAYEKAWLISPDGYPPLVTFARQSLGYQTQEQITGVNLFMELINIIGAEALPYTIYFIGGFGRIPYQTRDYFINIYPDMKNNFIGISTPPLGFLDNEQVFDAICDDINKKKPDIIFAGLTVYNQERIFLELQKRKVNYGLGIGVGRSIELVVGYQKAPPKVFTKLHLEWLHRAFTGNKGKGFKKSRYLERVIDDFKFAYRSIFQD